MTNVSRSKRWWAGATLVAIGAAWWIAAGRARDSQRVTIIVGLDISGSNHSRLPDDVRLTAEVLAHFPARRSHLVLCQVSRNCSVTYDGRLPNGPDALLTTLLQTARHRPEQTGTFPEQFWDTAVHLSEQSHGPLAVMLASDGERDDVNPTTTRRLKGSVSRLARCPNLRQVLFIGVKPECRASIERIFAPLGDRLVIHEFADVDADQLAAALR